MVSFYDFDWIECLGSSRSTTRFTVLLSANLISRHSKKQPTIACSSTETDYRVVAYTSVEIQWLCQLLWDLGILVLSFY